MSTLTVRRPDFSFANDLNIMPDRTDKHYAALSCAVTILAPQIERYLIRSMKSAVKELKNPALVELANDFCSQEANHFRNHDKLNELLRSKLSDKARGELEQAEADLQEDYRRFSNTKSLRFNLAYGEGFESATCALSLWAFEHQTTNALDPEWKSLIDWHLAEEVEHRTVAYDIYHALGGNYPHRLIWGTYAQAHLTKYILRFSRCFSQDFAHAGNEKHIIKQHSFSLVKRLLHTALPWYSPHKLTIHKDVDKLLELYS